MTTKLDRLLVSIGIDMTLEEAFGQADNAINTFSFKVVKIDKWDRFTECMGEFFRHLQFYILRLRKPLDIPVSEYWPKCAHVLIRVYGINGEKVAFEMARTGNEGGLYAVLKATAMRMAEDYAQNWISTQVNTYWNGLSVDEKLDAPVEYIAKFGHLLPSELTEKSAARIRANLPKFLEKHPYLIKQTNRVGR